MKIAFVMKGVLSVCLLVAPFAGSTPGQQARRATRAPVFTETALTFDGVDDYAMARSHSAFDLTSGFTLEAWILVTIPDPDVNIVSRQTQAGQWAPWSFTVRNNQLRLWLNGLTVLSDPVLTHSEWQHVAVTWRPARQEVTFYRNGVLAGIRAASSSIPSTPYNVIIGGVPGYPVGTCDGIIDEVRVWRGARSPGKIRSAMCRELRPWERLLPSLVGYWSFNEGSGQFAFDGSIYGHVVQLGSSPTPDPQDPEWACAPKWCP